MVPGSAETNSRLPPGVIAKWSANAPVAMVPQYVPALQSMTAIGMDTGDKDFVHPDVEAMHAELLKFGIRHDWEFYEGDHGNRVSERLQKIVFPFFAKHLAFTAR